MDFKTRKPYNVRNLGILAVPISTGLLVCALSGVHAKSDGAEKSEVAPVTFHVVRTASEILVDGALDESAWSEALELELNYEVRPGENVTPPVRTVLLITHDDRSVYFGFRAYDPEPSAIRARFTDRDRAWNDDWVGVVLDTFNDQRRAYELICNPLGVQIDAVNDDVLQNYDDSWNAIWKSAGRITAQGYEVEMSVPFHQIRFQASSGDPQTWGFDAMRSYPRTDRHHIGLFPRDRGNNSYLSQTVKLVGMQGASPGKNLEIAPTLTSSRADSREDLPDGSLQSGDVEADLGLSVRWGITPNVSLNGALNPDFSQVEADVLRLDINEQFTLFFPETRPFFLEGADYFSTPLDLIHTRSVSDPSSALKVTGKQGRHTYGLFTAQDDVTNLIFPGPESSSSGSFDFDTTSTVGRYRLDFAKNSTVGAAFTDRRGDDYRNQVASADLNFRITEADRVTTSFTTSRTRYSPEMIDEAGVRDDNFDDSVFQLEYLHTVRDWWIVADYGSFGEGFRSDLGFLPQVDYRQWHVGGARIWWGESGDFYRRLAWGGATANRERQSGELLEENVETWVNLDGPKQMSVQIDVNFRNQVFDQRRFDDQLFTHTWFEIQAGRDLWFAQHTDYGDWIDFANTRPAKRFLFQPRIRYNFGKHLLLQLDHTYTTLDVDGAELFRVHAPEARIIHQFNAKSFIRAIFQYTDIRRNVDLYLPDDDGEIDVEPRSKDLFTQLLFTYKVNPQTALYVGYTDSYLGTEDYSLTREARTLFVKLGYAWVK